MTSDNTTNAPEMVTLKPCPFCGGENVKTFGPYGWYRQWGISHSCKSFYNGSQEMFQGFHSEAEAITAWNTRAPVQQFASPSGLVEAIEAKVARLIQCAVDGDAVQPVARTIVAHLTQSPPPNDAVRERDAKFLHDLAGRIFRKAAPTLGFDQGDVDQLYRISRSLSAQPAPVERYRHKARGTEYEVIGSAELQVATGAGIAQEGDQLAVYRGDDGKLWARPSGEFHDGRFERLHPNTESGRTPVGTDKERGR